ncbi:MAG: hypothetical protein J07HX64_00797 [halophilic archaeon J07HX64]|nr:MAG: hypothetical protein J07HX64_00797 [halophilic archaeon J07HX64]
MWDDYRERDLVTDRNVGWAAVPVAPSAVPPALLPVCPCVPELELPDCQLLAGELPVVHRFRRVTATVERQQTRPETLQRVDDHHLIPVVTRQRPRGIDRPLELRRIEIDEHVCGHEIGHNPAVRRPAVPHLAGLDRCLERELLATDRVRPV